MVAPYEKGVPDCREIFQQGPQAIAGGHDLTPKSVVRHVVVKSEKSEEMMSRGEFSLQKFQDLFS